jgi:hypothetical protein
MHVSGHLHHKSYGYKFVESQHQRIDPLFRGVQGIVNTPIPRDGARRLNIPFRASDFDGVTEVANADLQAAVGRHTSIVVAVTEPNPPPIRVYGIVKRTAYFDDAVPWIAVTLYDGTIMGVQHITDS